MKNQTGHRLSAESLVQNYEKFFTIIDSFVERGPNLTLLYKSFGDRLIYEPASSFEHFHNAIPGGYVDHVLRVVEFSEDLYDIWKRQGLDCSNFTRDELRFAAFNHDLGKLGFSGELNGQYLVNKSEWHRKNMGKLYDINGAIPFVTVADRTNFLLQIANVPVSLNEYLGMKLTDGLYDKNNEAYLLANKAESKLRSNLPTILHHADMMASRLEWELWAKEGDLNTSMNYNSLSSDMSEGYVKVPKAAPVKKDPKQDAEDMTKVFDALFS